MITLTKEQLIAMRPCYLKDRLTMFGAVESLTAKQAVGAGFKISDLLWVAGQLGLKEHCVRFALLCAQRTAHLNPDTRVQAALDAAQAWLDNPCSEPARAAAAYAAARAADAADAADAAADAAARAAADAAAYAENRAQKDIFLQVFCGDEA